MYQQLVEIISEAKGMYQQLVEISSHPRRLR
jgi:hypothetical protein